MTKWGLSFKGQARIEATIDRGIFDHVEKIISSDEQKAIDAATLIGDHLGIQFQTDSCCGENDRSATGILPKEEFEAVATQFFAQPAQSIRGWEPAIDAQQRIVDAVHSHMKVAVEQHILFVRHGAVGTLLKCHLAQRPISRDEDQHYFGAPGGGNMFAFDWTGQHLLSDWVALENWT
ncbi:histidine phosphatase family protein [Maritalea myrionectae]|uniref:histidine phosphatase family protein n=1 Tax=Maritalea myrionectae TaxID=454601 RepID=UPI001FEDAB9E|nr:histidine phosphatase family protein [Maritalea myrionectae]